MAKHLNNVLLLSALVSLGACQQVRKVGTGKDGAVAPANSRQEEIRALYSSASCNQVGETTDDYVRPRFRNPASQTAQESTTGLRGTLALVTNSGYMDLRGKLYSDTLNVPSKLIQQGFKTFGGDLLGDLRKYNVSGFNFLFDGAVQLNAGDPEGLYEFALLADDDVRLRMGPEEMIVDRSDMGSLNLVCVSGAFDMRQGQRVPMEVEYAQGPKRSVTAMLLWRRSSGSQEKLCTTFRNLAETVDQADEGNKWVGVFFDLLKQVPKILPPEWKNLIGQFVNPSVIDSVLDMISSFAQGRSGRRDGFTKLLGVVQSVLTGQAVDPAKLGDFGKLITSGRLEQLNKLVDLIMKGEVKSPGDILPALQAGKFGDLSKLLPLVFGKDVDLAKMGILSQLGQIGQLTQLINVVNSGKVPDEAVMKSVNASLELMKALEARGWQPVPATRFRLPKDETINPCHSEEVRQVFGDVLPAGGSGAPDEAGHISLPN
jgi:hypothetical protein